MDRMEGVTSNFFYSVKTCFMSTYVGNTRNISMWCWKRDIYFCLREMFYKYLFGLFILCIQLALAYLWVFLVWTTSHLARVAYWSHSQTLHWGSAVILIKISNVYFMNLGTFVVVNRCFEFQYLSGFILWWEYNTLLFLISLD